MQELISIFTDSETPFLLLFVILFWFYLREAKAREERMENRVNETNKGIESKIEEVQQDQKVMLSIWKLLIEEELERRESNGIYRRGNDSE